MGILTFLNSHFDFIIVLFHSHTSTASAYTASSIQIEHANHIYKTCDPSMPLKISLDSIWVQRPMLCVLSIDIE